MPTIISIQPQVGDLNVILATRIRSENPRFFVCRHALGKYNYFAEWQQDESCTAAIDKSRVVANQTFRF